MIEVAIVVVIIILVLANAVSYLLSWAYPPCPQKEYLQSAKRVSDEAVENLGSMASVNMGDVLTVTESEAANREHSQRYGSQRDDKDHEIEEVNTKRKKPASKSGLSKALDRMFSTKKYEGDPDDGQTKKTVSQYKGSSGGMFEAEMEGVRAQTSASRKSGGAPRSQFVHSLKSDGYGDADSRKW